MGNSDTSGFSQRYRIFQAGKFALRQRGSQCREKVPGAQPTMPSASKPMTMRISRRSSCGAIPTTLGSFSRPNSKPLPIRQGHRKDGRAWLGDGASAFRCDPTKSAKDEPAHWSPAVLGTTIVCSSEADSEYLVSEGSWTNVHSRKCSDGLQQVLNSPNGRHRLWCTALAQGQSPAFLVPDDTMALVRSEGLHRFQLARIGRTAAAISSTISPTDYQRRRLTMMLAMLDARAVGARARDLAFGLVYRNSTPLEGADWKASGEKRHTLRLLRAALRLRAGGHRTFQGFDRSISSE